MTSSSSKDVNLKLGLSIDLNGKMTIIKHSQFDSTKQTKWVYFSEKYDVGNALETCHAKNILL